MKVSVQTFKVDSSLTVTILKFFGALIFSLMIDKSTAIPGVSTDNLKPSGFSQLFPGHAQHHRYFLHAEPTLH